MRNIALTLCMLAMMCSCGNKNDGSFELRGKIGRWNAPAKLYFSYMDDGEQTDSALLDNGHFSFTGRIDHPAAARLILDYTGEGMAKALWDGNFLLLYIDEETITLKSQDSLRSAEIHGSPINDQYRDYLAYIGGPIQDLNAAMNTRAAAATDEQRDDPGFWDAMNREYRAALDHRAELQREYARGNPHSHFSVVALAESAGSRLDPEVIEPIFNAIDETVRNRPEGQALAQRINAARTITVGSHAPDFTQRDPDGRPVSLSDFRGGYVLLDFWASWCGPCRAESPYLVEAIGKYGDRGFDVLGVSLDSEKDRDAWLRAMQEDGYSWTNISDLKGWSNAAARLYGITAIPQNYLIDPRGVIVAQNLRGDELIAHLDELFR